MPCFMPAPTFESAGEMPEWMRPAEPAPAPAPEPAPAPAGA